MAITINGGITFNGGFTLKSQSHTATQSASNNGSNAIHVDVGPSWLASVPVGATIVADGYGTFTVTNVSAPGDPGNGSGNWYFTVDPVTSNFNAGTNLTFTW